MTLARLGWPVLAAALTVLALFSSSPPKASASSCDTIQSRGGYDLVFYKRHMKCGTAKRYAKRLMRHGSYDAPGFTCHRQNPDNGGCTNDHHHRKFFVFYTPD